MITIIFPRHLRSSMTAVPRITAGNTAGDFPVERIEYRSVRSLGYENPEAASANGYLLHI